MVARAPCSLPGIEGPVRPGTERNAEPADRRREQVAAVARGLHPALGDGRGVAVAPATILHSAGIDVVANPPAALSPSCSGWPTTIARGHRPADASLPRHEDG